MNDNVPCTGYSKFDRKIQELFVLFRTLSDGTIYIEIKMLGLIHYVQICPGSFTIRFYLQPTKGQCLILYLNIICAICQPSDCPVRRPGPVPRFEPRAVIPVAGTLTPPDLKIIIKKYRKLFKTTQNRGISNFLYVHWYKLFSWVI